MPERVSPKAGDRRRPTISDVATTAGVSITTAVRVLSGRGYASVSARKRVTAAVDEIGYVPNLVARSLRHGRTAIIGLVVADIENPFYSAIAKSVERVMSKAGYSVVLLNSDDDPAMERQLLDVLERLRVSGLIVTPAGSNRARFERLRRDGTAIVQISRSVPRLNTDSVLVDNRMGACDAVTALIEAGHRRIGLLAGSPGVNSGVERSEGYVKALTDHGLAVDPSLMRGRSFHREHAIDEARSLLAERPRATAIFAANNLLAESCLQALKELGLDVPRDVSLVAFDDVHWMALVKDGITTMRLPVGEMARTAAEMILERLADKSARPSATVIFRPELVVRGSIAPPPPGQ